MTNLRTVVFFDGQNLYRGAKDAWSSSLAQPGSRYSYPSYDVEKLADYLVKQVADRVLTEIRFYTGVPDPNRGQMDKFWHGFWSNKLRYLGSKGIYVYKGRVNQSGHEKGVDVSIATDLVRLTYEQKYEVAILVTQDWDFGPAVRLVKEIARGQGRTLYFESAFPYNPSGKSKRGVPGTKWVYIDKATYDSCYDPTDYRPFIP